MKEKWKWKETQTFVTSWTILEDFESTVITLQTVYLTVNTKQNNFLSPSLSSFLSFSFFLSLFLSSTLLNEVFKQSLRADVSSYSPLIVWLTWNSFHWLKNEGKVKKFSKTTFFEWVTLHFFFLSLLLSSFFSLPFSRQRIFRWVIKWTKDYGWR